MNSHWISLTRPEDLQEAIEASHEKPVVIFKHSYRCSISIMAAHQMRLLEADLIGRYFIDVITHRASSMALAQLSGVQHESPQALLYVKGQLVWSGSHGEVRADLLQAKYRQALTSTT